MDLEDSKSTWGGSLCIFGKSNCNIWGHIIRCRFTHGLHLRSGLLGSGDWSVTFFITPLALGANSVKYVWMEERWSSLLSRQIFVWQQLITSLQTHYVLSKALLSILEYVDTRNQLANILTKSTFTRDEWHHFLGLFIIMINSMFSRV